MRNIWICLLIAVSAAAQPVPTDYRYWINLGVSEYKAAKYAEAVSAFQMAADLKPDDLAAHNYLATAYMVQWIPGADSPENNEFARRAEAEFRRVLTLDSRDTTALAYLASLAFNQASSGPAAQRFSKFDEAMAWNERLIEVDPQNKEALYNKGVIAWTKWHPALMAARVKLQMKPEDPGPLPNATIKRDLLARFGALIDRGIADLKRAIEIDLEYDDALAYLNLLIRERADLRDTKEEYDADIEGADELLQRALDAKKAKAQRAEEAANPARISAGALMMERRLLRKVDPIYPAAALDARIQGIVRLNAIVDKDGHVQHVDLVSGHPLLVQAAKDAAKQYIYDVTRVNGEPVDVVTSIEIRFSLR
jgi:TonB family protein